MNLSVKELDRLAVEWYREHGRHPERIKKNALGHEWVVSDFSWNYHRSTQRERITETMRKTIMDKYYGYKA